MPGWHAKTEALIEAKKLKVAGIVQEQHPDRALLYMQWQQMKWPVLADPFNELEIKAVPITLLIDRHGIIRYKNPRSDDLTTFLATDYSKEAKGKILKKETPLLNSIDQLQKRIIQQPKDAQGHFQLGVAYRKRHDSNKRHLNDFAKAIESWQRALALNPDQYIWRRRIQQYGPRLDKPYSFYDWVNRARKEIIARGETPYPLTTEPGGSEFAYPVKGSHETSAVNKHPDPEGKITQDTSSLVTVQTVVVPSTKGDGQAIRIHLRFQPQKNRSVHWTNDAGNISFFPQTHDSITIHDQQAPPALPKKTLTSEERIIEFEVRPVKGNYLPKSIEGAAFYYVCEGTNGVCHYLRQDIVIPLTKPVPSQDKK